MVLGPTLIKYDLILITFAKKTLFPKKITFTCTKGFWFNIPLLEDIFNP